MFHYDGFYGILNSFNLARFGNFNFRFNFSDRFFNKNIGTTPEQASEPQANEALPQAEQPAVADIPPDTIEISSPNQPTSAGDVESATYSPTDMVKKAETPAAESDSESEDAPEASPETAPEEDPQAPESLIEKKWLSLIDLNMKFNLVEFEKTLRGVLQDAEDGEIDEASLTKIAMGLHVDLKAKARVSEVYQSGDTADAQVNEASRTRVKARQALRAMLKTRGFEARMFYRESLKTSSSMHSRTVDGFLRVSRKLSMRYSQDFSLRLNSLNLFNSQAQELDQTGNAASYINSTENLVDTPQTSGDLIGKFFEAVQGYLDNSQSMITEKIDQFFSSLADEMGLDNQLFQSTRDALLSNVSAFFDRVDQAVSTVMDRYSLPAPAPEPELPQPEPAPNPPTPQPETADNDVTATEMETVAA